MLATILLVLGLCSICIGVVSSFAYLFICFRFCFLLGTRCERGGVIVQLFLMLMVLRPVVIFGCSVVVVGEGGGEEGGVVVLGLVLFLFVLF